ncbi:thiolase family protein [Candidatus Woesearchaeota archaeon]|nr:thiolase family protein [Candidatus Woesearchaeota archaeon]
MKERVYIVNARRLPCCKSKGDKIPAEEGGDGKKSYPGKYEAVGSVELLSYVLKYLLKTTPVPVDDIDDLLVGCALQDGDQGANVAKIVQLVVGMPYQVPSATINRLCGSSLTSTMKAAEFLIAGQGFKDEKPGLVFVGGVENMGKHNMMEAFTPSKYFYDEFGKNNTVALSMGLTAEKLAEVYKIPRIEQEKFAYHSHAKAIKAQNEGKFNYEIIPVTLPDGEVLTKDVGPRNYSSLEEAIKAFGKLKPAFKNGGSVTAATSAPFTDGAAGLVVATETYMKKHKLEPMAEIISWASVGVDPSIMGYGPVDATKKALKRAGMDLKQMGLIEMNEAFCAQAMACIKQLSKDYKLDEDEFRSIINVNGGATALGHPLGATGAKILTTLTYELLKRPDVEYGLATMCIGMGQGDAIIVRNCKYK